MEELEKRLSKKSRYNRRREKKIVKEQLGGYLIKNYTIESREYEGIMHHYFHMKEKTHGVSYALTPSQYKEVYYISDIYTLEIEGEIKSIILSCEQGESVFLENITYEKELQKYSLGKIIYDEYLRRLMEKGKKEVFLLGGDYNYKKEYRSIESYVTNVEVYRNDLLKLCYAFLFKFLRQRLYYHSPNWVKKRIKWYPRW